jgi:hypothetical protein
MANAKKVTRSASKKVKDPIIAAKARFDAAGEDDVAHDAAMVDLENETPSTAKGVHILEVHTRYLQELARHDVVDRRRLRHLTKMMKRVISCRQRLASKRTG